MGSISDEFPPLAALPNLSLHPSIDAEQLNAAKIADDWLASLSKSLSTGHPDAIQAHFLEKESWWRDFVSFSWDIACHNGSQAISSYLASSTSGFSDPKLDQPGALQPHLADLGGMRFIQAGFGFTTKAGKGRGVLRLANVGPEEWKAWTVFTVLERLNGQDELEAERAKAAEVQSSGSGPQSTTEDSDLQVLVVGAGQSGLALAAHLQNLGLKYLVVDKTARPGDSWRARYTSIKSHTPSYMDHFPFLKYPTTWPRYLDQDHIVKWMEHYGDLLGLNVRHGTLAINIQYNPSTKRYSVDLQSNDGSVQSITTKHLVLATGLLSDIPVKPSFPGEDTFKGQVFHTSAHQSASLMPDVQNKKITIIGAGTSAHDVAQDFASHGAKSVTIVQRSPLFVTSLKSVEELQVKLWDTPGLSTDDADLLGNSFPTAVVRTLSVGASQMMSMLDKDMLDGLEKAGLAVKRGDQGDSLVDHQLIKAGHFYIDQGACGMILDGRIKVQRCQEGVREYYPGGITLADGTQIESDVVILATGFERTDKLIERIVPREILDRVPGVICSLDGSQERFGVWRPTGMPGFWYMTGSFSWSRQFSPVLALQIAAVEWGLNKENQG
ncbi:flavin-binding monooxygenase [Aspergillus costaricaensis CBS 115574]|uniref:Flavin-binding monooxygenase n=1 Tax=Aspergillus costaricaensis CBS 115574 TaxID=1448317 RepID=A0ACD1I872_9EURO|nr:flavin-binding monooxygenase [Aspergillus costaricaensis CBS 115574]RAK86774.1 flavin-binding monooxygenase [Aspergillus costaricaensis CBS 115574]